MPEQITDVCNPSFIGRRQQHTHFAARTVFEFDPQSANENAGLVLLQNKDNHFRFLFQDCQVVLTERRKGDETLFGSVIATGHRHYLKVEARGQQYSFYYASEPEAWIPVAEKTNGRLLSTQVAGGFVGAYIGLYGSSNGISSESVADFDYFEYTPLR